MKRSATLAVGKKTPTAAKTSTAVNIRELVASFRLNSDGLSYATDAQMILFHKRHLKRYQKSIS